MRVFLVIIMLCIVMVVACGPSESVVDNAVKSVLQEWSNKYMEKGRWKTNYLNKPIEHSLSEYQCENDQCTAVVEIEYTGVNGRSFVYCPFCKGSPKSGHQKVRLLMIFDKVGDNLHFKERRIL